MLHTSKVVNQAIKLMSMLKTFIN